MSRLERLGVRLAADGDNLRVNAARGQIDEELKREILASKAELIALVSGNAERESFITGAPVAGDSCPLSVFQERLWLLQRLEPENCAFLLVASWLVREGADPTAVVQAVVRLQERHDILRMSFVEQNGVPVARCGDAPAVVMHDLSALEDDAAQSRMELDGDRALRTPVDLAVEPALQLSVYALPGARVRVLLRAHHIAIDASSIGLLRRELDVMLADADALRERPVQFADYALWQRNRLLNANVSGDLEWWVEALRGAPQVCTFKPDRPIPATGVGHAGAGHAIGFSWDPVLSEALRGVARQYAATPYMVLLAGLATLLRVHTGQGDIVLGSPMGMRERAELESVVGPFVNLLVLRIDLGDDPPFGVAIRRARDALLDAHARRDVPFESILERLRPPRSNRHSPVFQVSAVQHETGTINDMALAGGGALHELTWYLREAEGQFRGSVEFSSDLYSDAAISRLISQMETLLKDAACDPQRPVSQLRLLDAEAWKQVVSGFNPPCVQLDDMPVHRRFERRAADSPAEAALTFADVDVDYGELNRRANRLATFLREAGSVPGRVVAICLERSIEMVVALLAVQKSGAAYLPLDPGFPSERLAYMIEDSGATLVIADANVAQSLPLPDDVCVVDPAQQGGRIESCDDGNLAGDPRAEDPAYVIYTSGSTGRPKGVVVSHGALANFVGSMAVEPGLRPGDVFAAVTTISFDIAGLELYLPLSVGARVLLIDRETALDGEALAQALEAGEANVLQATPATWRLLIEADWAPTRPIRALCGGEALPRDLADQLLSRVAELWNMYGPTETTIWSTIARVEPAPQDITIGRPISNTQIYVVDDHGMPLPIGVPGEIWIGGKGVALGYHQRPELTAERFVPDDFGDRAGARLYRTGDLGYWDAEGRLHHLGRRDHQVKIRGYRIELGEIEAELAELPDIRQGVVLVRDMGHGDHRLVAYVVVASGSSVVTSEIRRALKRRLPEYMIPSFVIELPAIPLTPNGKVDRAALPDPYGGEHGAKEVDEPPRPGMESTIAEVWKQVLKIESVGASDNFFDLGGHSLLTFRVVALIRERTGRKLDPRQLFFQSLRQLAEAVADAG
ncbi:MAG: amino acid adenylation domain-containing protein [Sinobacteraceae bacterium]|nr:amino acid adenylation domain-containing protein [Nevskiaceae bacterium]